MERDEHRQTASWGSSRDARAYRQEQARLIEQGNFQAAQNMDIQDLPRAKSEAAEGMGQSRAAWISAAIYRALQQQA
jgi:hypothetical protein